MYEIAAPDYLHAVGVLSASYNLLEFQLRLLMDIYCRMSSDSTMFVFVKMSNDERLKLLKMCSDAAGHPQAIKRRVDHFVKGFDVCTQNRNIIAHSEIITGIGVRGRPVAIFRKPASKAPFGLNLYRPSIRELRGMANATFRYQAFGNALAIHIAQQYEPAKFMDGPFADLQARPRYSLPKLPKPPVVLQPSRGGDSTP